MNPLLSRYVPSSSLQIVYDRVKTLLVGHDLIIFEAMADITRTNANPFVAPVSAAGFEQKHREVVQRFRFGQCSEGLNSAQICLLQSMIGPLQVGGLAHSHQKSFSEK